MKVSGEAVVHAGMDRVYASLQDPAVLVRVIPGCQRLERTGPDAYRATVQAGVAAIKGTFDGDVRLTDQDAPHRFTMHAAGAGTPGTVSAVVAVVLAPGDDGTTVVRYDADATIGGVIGGVGQRMLAGVARRTAGEFFAGVDRELAAAAVAAPTPVSGAPGPVGGLPAPVAGAGSGAAAGPVAAPAGVLGGAPGVWTATRTGDAVAQAARQRVRDLVLGAIFGAVVVLLGVLVGALVAGR
jgi:carbon monoxide dehydrogenase subunit G